jgi:hypothetical protein
MGYAQGVCCSGDCQGGESSCPTTTTDQCLPNGFDGCWPPNTTPCCSGFCIQNICEETCNGVGGLCNDDAHCCGDIDCIDLIGICECIDPTVYSTTCDPENDLCCAGYTCQAAEPPFTFLCAPEPTTTTAPCPDTCQYRCGDWVLCGVETECDDCPDGQFCIANEAGEGWCCPGTSLGTDENCRWCGDACDTGETCQSTGEDAFDCLPEPTTTTAACLPTSTIPNPVTCSESGECCSGCCEYFLGQGPFCRNANICANCSGLGRICTSDSECCSGCCQGDDTVGTGLCAPAFTCEVINASEPVDAFVADEPESCDTCESLGLWCGSAHDGCGNVLDCGACCQPLTCAELRVPCGPAVDNCGDTIDCGPCG